MAMPETKFSVEEMLDAQRSMIDLLKCSGTPISAINWLVRENMKSYCEYEYATPEETDEVYDTLIDEGLFDSLDP